MALPTVADVKDYLRIPAAEVSEDALLAKLLARAQAQCEAFLSYAFVAVARTHVDYGPGVRDMDIVQLPGPFALVPAPVLTNATGGVVAASSYTLDARGGKLRAKAGWFGARPLSVVATIGLSAHPDYAAWCEAVAATALVDLVAHLYQNRNPAQVAATDEGGAFVDVGENATTYAIPQRIAQDLLTLPCTVGLVMA